MASFTAENRGTCIDDLDSLELSQVDHCGALLMSFLGDNMQVIDEDWDDERLTTVMRSLEAEIHVQQQVAEDKNSFDHECKQVQENSTSSNNILNFDLKDMEMEMEMERDHDDVMASLFPADLMASWYMHAASSSSGHEMCGTAFINHHEHGNVDHGDYFLGCNYNSSFEDHEHDSYAPLC